MNEKFSRTALLLGEEAVKSLSDCRVAVFGAGGVGGYTIEALARSGVGAIDIIDNDTISESNINRQIIATVDTIGQYKVDVAEKRVKSINPDIKVTTHKTFFLPENSNDFDFSLFDYIVDAIDTVSGKIELAVKGEDAGVPVISAMGAGNKLDPTAFEVTDIYKTTTCPLARVMRRELKKRGVEKLKVVYSTEEPVKHNAPADSESGKPVPGSVAFVPPVCGLIIAGEVIKDLIK